VQLIRSHGLGNDYLVLESGETMTPQWVQALCDRHSGVGGDGVLEPFETERGDYGVRIWNPDGSVAEKSGNGLRIFARWLVDERGAPSRFTVWTGSCLVGCEVDGDALAVEMGQATFVPAEVPVLGEAPLLDAPLKVGIETLPVIAVGVGNPHCVVFEDLSLDELPWRTWGPLIEHHEWFPRRTNVQFARVLDARTVEIRIWERGAGETSASGSSSCGVAAAGVRTGRLKPGRITVQMPGGTLWVTVREDYSLRLEGPVQVIGRVEVHPDWLLHWEHAHRANSSSRSPHGGE
jgi:diaminopimelate epimerase